MAISGPLGQNSDTVPLTNGVFPENGYLSYLCVLRDS